MKPKHDKHSEMRFTSYLDKNEYLIWVGEPQDNRFLGTRHVRYSCFNAITSSIMLIFSTIAFMVFVFAAPMLFIFPLLLLLMSFLMIFRVSKRYYAISNKRLFIMERGIFNSLQIEALSHLQKLSIHEDQYNSFSINFEPISLVYGREQGLKQDYPLIFAAKRLEGLSQADAQAAYDLLMMEREERAEELDLLE